MSLRRAVEQSEFASFRVRLLVAMALLVGVVAIIGLYVADRNVTSETEHDRQRDFDSALETLHRVQEVRHAALAERCRILITRPRIHAALEDNALDLLYPSAKDELRDIIATGEEQDDESVLRARFYRFLDGHGAVIPPPSADGVGALDPHDEARLSLPHLPAQQQTGCLVRKTAGGEETIDEVIAMPIASTETGEVISALVVGFKATEPGHLTRGMTSGVWVDGSAHLPALSVSAASAISQSLLRTGVDRGVSESHFRMNIDGTPHQVFLKRLNPGSLFAPVVEVCLYPLTDLLARQRTLRWQAAGACAVLLLGGVMVSHILAARLSKPVQRLAETSEEHRTQRARAEAALEQTSEELQRAARFSADTSHQLKTPVTVLRAGLEELLANEQLAPEIHDEIAGMIHQTFRLTSIIEDLLLLSRMDAGNVKIEFQPVNLNRLIEAWLDDLSAIPEGPDVEVEIDLPEALEIAGEQRYTSLILQNLLVNARKYNRSGGEIRITGDEEGEWATLTIANTGKPIPAAAQEYIFERFHRGAMAENIPGHGLGLNVARELMRLHHGDLRLVRSDDEWTVFELRFRLAKHPPVAKLEYA